MICIFDYPINEHLELVYSVCELFTDLRSGKKKVNQCKTILSAPIIYNSVSKSANIPWKRAHDHWKILNYIGNVILAKGYRIWLDSFPSSVSNSYDLFTLIYYIHLSEMSWIVMNLAGSYFYQGTCGTNVSGLGQIFWHRCQKYPLPYRFTSTVEF